MLSDISQTEKYKYCMISLTHGILKSQTHESREQNGGCQLAAVGGIREMLFKGTNLQPVDEYVLES